MVAQPNVIASAISRSGLGAIICEINTTWFVSVSIISGNVNHHAAICFGWHVVQPYTRRRHCPWTRMDTPRENKWVTQLIMYYNVIAPSDPEEADLRAHTGHPPWSSRGTSAGQCSPWGDLVGRRRGRSWTPRPADHTVWPAQTTARSLWRLSRGPSCRRSVHSPVDRESWLNDWFYFGIKMVHTTHIYTCNSICKTKSI